MNTIDTSQYPDQLNSKTKQIKQTFAEFTVPELEVFASKPSHYRLRAEFRIWHTGDLCYYAMTEKGNKKNIYEVIDFPIASELINRLMPELLQEINTTPALKHRLFQAEFLTTLSGDALITLIYHRQLDDEWKEIALALQTKLGVSIIGRARKQKVVLDRDFVIEELTVDNKNYKYKQIEGGFTQPNGEMNQAMLTWAQSCL